MNAAQCRTIFERFRALNPHPTTELKFDNWFELLIAVILSAQATDVSVNKATRNLFSVANTPEKIISLGETGLKPFIKSIGLYNTKAKNIIKTCRILIEEYHSQVPRDRQSLESLPGVGRKTANVIMNTAFGDSTIAVDTHIFRVARRIGFSEGQQRPGRLNRIWKNGSLKNIYAMPTTGWYCTDVIFAWPANRNVRNVPLSICVNFRIRRHKKNAH